MLAENLIYFYLLYSNEVPGLEKGEGLDDGVDEFFCCCCHGNGQSTDMRKNIIYSLISLETSKTTIS